jgi:hypothetical protein
MKFSFLTSSKLFLFLMIFMCAGAARAQSKDFLSRVAELQETAAQASGGVLGCGEGGTFQIKTSRGNVLVNIGDDAIHVFGNSVAVVDLLPLLEARAEFNATGVPNQMSGEVGSLMYVVLDVLSRSKDPEAIAAIGALLADKNERVVQYAYFALLNLGKSDSDLQKQVEAVVFPESALKILKSYGIKLPDWVKTRQPTDSILK